VAGDVSVNVTVVGRIAELCEGVVGCADVYTQSSRGIDEDL
jgi:hypothetical protein